MKKETEEEALIRLLKEAGATIVDYTTKETYEKIN